MTQSTYARRREEVLAAALSLGRAIEALAGDGHTYAGLTDQLNVLLGREAGDKVMALTGAVMVLDLTPPNAITDSDGAYVVGSPETSRRAAKALFPKSGSVRRKVLDDIWNRRDGLATDEMIERSLGGKHQTVSSARNWLMNAGWVEDSRLRTADKKAVLWQLTEAAKAHIREELQP